MHLAEIASGNSSSAEAKITCNRLLLAEDLPVLRGSALPYPSARGGRAGDVVRIRRPAGAELAESAPVSQP